MVQAKCVVCHVSEGVSGGTRLVFKEGAGQAVYNAGVFAAFLQGDAYGANVILAKVRGDSNHGGGVVFAANSVQYSQLSLYLSGLTHTAPASTALAKVVVDTPQATLRRALLLMTGRLPSEQELTAVATGDKALRHTLRQALQGDGFHQFLIRAANDRLLTDAFFHGQYLEVMDSNTGRYPLLSNKEAAAYAAGTDAYNAFEDWRNKLFYGVARAPLELIAYVAETDRPYTEVLTADYTLVNPQSAEVFNSGITFSNSLATTFKPGKNSGQILFNSQLQYVDTAGPGAQINAHSGFVDYPHAGVLNEPAFLNRYPSTETNRNRARTRWTFYHFLDFDIEKSASRTTNPLALADTNNPTLNNPACTVCHQVMDPVAGAFQSFGDKGWYHDAWGGLDSLPSLYKNGTNTPYTKGDTWYKDMRLPGLGNVLAPSMGDSLPWLAQQIVADARFAKATVKFWWPAVMSEPLLTPPTDSSSADYSALLRAYDAQMVTVDALASQFSQGFHGGQAYNLKDLLVELITTDWFRGRSHLGALSASEAQELDTLGAGRLLTPEELDAKTRALLGEAWGENVRNRPPYGLETYLNQRFTIYYGGIDSDGITERARLTNTLMSNVAMAQALSMACPSVLFDFNQAAGQQRLFTKVSRYITPVSMLRESAAITAEAASAVNTFSITPLLTEGNYRLKLSFDNPYWDKTQQKSSLLVVQDITVTGPDGAVVLKINGSAFPNTPGAEFSRTDQGAATGYVFWDPIMRANRGWAIWSGYAEIPLVIAKTGTHRITLTASRQNLPERSVRLGVGVNALTPNAKGAGEQAIRKQLQVFHERFLGETLALNSPEINASYDAFVDFWQVRKTQGFGRSAVEWGKEVCEIDHPGFWEKDNTDVFADPEQAMGAWISFMVYLLTDYRYLHE